jgi:hypothetical protein
VCEDGIFKLLCSHHVLSLFPMGSQCIPQAGILQVPAKGHSEPAPTSAPLRMNGKWSGNSFLLAFSSLANHGG